MLAVAKTYVAGGLSVIPVRTDGSKAPSLRGWSRYCNQLPTDAELQSWFRNGHVGIGITCGKASKNLEVLDIDEASLIKLLQDEIESRSPGLLERLPMVRTGGQKYHYYFRSDRPQGGTKLAKAADGRTLIETRGHGHQVVAPGSPAGCHPSGRTYEHIGGPPLTEVPTITDEERTVLLNAARKFDQSAPDNAQEIGFLEGGDDNRPGDDFNRRATWPEILEPHGWVLGETVGAEGRWRRPGKDTGISATTGHHGNGQDDTLYVFSTNATPFKSETGYTKFSAHALLNYGGNFAQTAQALREQGYGTNATRGLVKSDGASIVPADKTSRMTLATRRLSLIEPREIDWLWPDRIALAGVTMLCGEPGEGKSYLTRDLAARLSAGLGWPDKPDERQTPQDVLILCCEDDPEQIVVPHITRAGGDLDRVVLIDGVDVLSRRQFFSLEKHLAALDMAIAANPNLALVVIDPVAAYMGRVDSHRHGDVYGILGPVADVAKSRNVAILVVQHVNKSKAPSALERQMGSVAFSALARNVWYLTKDPESDDDRDRLFLHGKSNLGPRASGLRFKIVGPTGAAVVEWCLQPVELSADDAFLAETRAKDSEEDRTAIEYASSRLREALAAGPMRAKDLGNKMEAEGVSKRTLERAKQQVGAKSRPISDDKGRISGWEVLVPVTKGEK